MRGHLWLRVLDVVLATGQAAGKVLAKTPAEDSPNQVGRLRLQFHSPEEKGDALCMNETQLHYLAELGL